MLVLAVGGSGTMLAWLHAQSVLAHEPCHLLTLAILADRARSAASIRGLPYTWRFA